MKIVLSGTDSLGFWFTLHQELYDRAKAIHTTFIPYREHSRLLGIDSMCGCSAGRAKTRWTGFAHVL